MYNRRAWRGSKESPLFFGFTNVSNQEKKCYIIDEKFKLTVGVNYNWGGGCVNKPDKRIYKINNIRRYK